MGLPCLPWPRGRLPRAEPRPHGKIFLAQFLYWLLLRDQRGTVPKCRAEAKGGMRGPARGEAVGAPGALPLGLMRPGGKPRNGWGSPDPVLVRGARCPRAVSVNLDPARAGRRAKGGWGA